MDVLLLWMCFLTVLVASGLAVGVLVREARRHLAVRGEAAVAPQAPTVRAHVHVPASRTASSSGEQQPRRGLGQLIPAVPATADDAPRRRGLGQLLSEQPA